MTGRSWDRDRKGRRHPRSWIWLRSSRCLPTLKTLKGKYPYCFYWKRWRTGFQSWKIHSASDRSSSNTPGTTFAESRLKSITSRKSCWSTVATKSDSTFINDVDFTCAWPMISLTTCTGFTTWLNRTSWLRTWWTCWNRRSWRRLRARNLCLPYCSGSVTP